MGLGLADENDENGKGERSIIPSWKIVNLHNLQLAAVRFVVGDDVLICLEEEESLCRNKSAMAMFLYEDNHLLNCMVWHLSEEKNKKNKALNNNIIYTPSNCPFKF